ncbi:MAG: AAA family ATPase [Candidatus Levybacteria bacterium]|nr:AAA family ATPase [Candidatus Levybacteria bacterium]
MDTAQTPPGVPEQVSDSSSQIKKLDDLILAAKLPEELAQSAKAMVARLKIVRDQPSFYTEYDIISRYITWITALPWNRPSQDILDLAHAKKVLDANHYGLGVVKEQILEFLSVMILTRQRAGVAGSGITARAPILSLVGLAGVGKTTIAYSIAEALGRKIERIPFGGMGSAAQLRGKSRLYSDSEPGYVIKALRRAGTSNPVILLDEIDRVSTEGRADIMGVLVELLDPMQNKAFTDHFIDFPVDLSQVLFIATSNNTKDISTAVVDRLEIIQMPSYTDEEKTVIGKTYVLPHAMKEAGLTANDFAIADDVWPEAIVRPLGYDPGIRGLQRVLQGIVRKTVYYMMLGKIPQGQKFVVTNENIKSFISAW